MQPLILSRQLLTWHCLCYEKGSPVWKQLIRIVLSASAFLMNLSCVPTSILYVLKFLSVNLEESLYALFQVAACTSAAYVVAIAFRMRYRTANLFKMLEDIYNSRK